MGRTNPYALFQRANPEWPRRKRDAHGRYARLRRDVKTKGGTEFEAGEAVQLRFYGGRGFQCSAVYRTAFISGVHPRDLKLLPEGWEPEGKK